MKTLYVIVYAIGFLFLMASNSTAFKQEVPSSPTETTRASDDVHGDLFIGDAGEILELPYGWGAQPIMRAETEFVFIHRKPGATKRIAGGKLEAVTTVPKDSDYKAENFTPLGLMELVVMPKDAPGGYKDLSDLRRVKDRDLKAHGADYSIQDNCGYRQHFDFPRKSFQVAVRTPYRMFQCYSESPKSIFILTTGYPAEGNPDRPAILFAFETLERSLEKYLSSVNPPAKPSLDLRGLWMWRKAWLVLNGLLLLLILFHGPNPFIKRLNFIGCSLILFFNISGIIGILIPYISFLIGSSLWQKAYLVSVLPPILGPWICRYAALRLHADDSRRAFLWSWLAAIPLGIVSVHDFLTVAAPGSTYDAFSIYFFSFVVAGIAFGLIFSFTVTPSNHGETI